ncbi:MAG TPA: ComF family protein, partial [Alphaproteobacteria bacterium]|nr:ComF family protein [Alphaproteobacteria bacterium]
DNARLKPRLSRMTPTSMLPALKNAAQHCLNVLLPPLCLSCDALVERTQGFCGKCWSDLHFIAAPFCASCGLPFEYAALMPDNAQCGACIAEPPLFKQARAALNYDDASRELILPFKSHDRTDYAPAFARLMQQAGGALLQASDIIIPVPLHPFRLFTRRYNQAALLALALGRLSRKPVRLQALRRRKSTPSQGHLSRAQRRQNVAGAFRVAPHEKKNLQGRSVLLIDDVLTTGATANACAKELLKAGAKDVRVLALARVKKAN